MPVEHQQINNINMSILSIIEGGDKIKTYTNKGQSVTIYQGIDRTINKLKNQ